MHERNKACKKKPCKSYDSLLGRATTSIATIVCLVCWSKQLLTADYKMIIQFINANMTMKTILIKTE